MSEQIQASHILVSHLDARNASSSLTKNEALTHIEELKSKVLSEASFAEVAVEYSDCPSADKGGDLGLFSRGAMVQAFDIAAFNLKVGETSEIVETEFGYHLIYRTA